MERKSIKTLVAVGLFALFPSVTHAQTYTFKHDNSKYQVIRSTENGTWGFTPGLYFYVMHNSYSGAYFKGLSVKFKESKSKTQRVSVPRMAQIPLEMSTVSRLDNQIDSIQPLVTEETLRSAERMVDITYSQYKDDFQELSESITESLSYCLLTGGTGVLEACETLQQDYDEICSAIEYIHQQGPGYEIEPTKRQIAYEDVKQRLSEMEASCDKLVRYVSTLK